ncbi:MAG: hypothetical protein AABW90_02095 [Nanoarchaeota archaeon]
MKKTTKKTNKRSGKIKKEILKGIKNSFNLEFKRVGWKKISTNIKDKKFNQEKKEGAKELETVIEKTSAASASSFNLENFRNLNLEEIIPVLKERGFQQTRPRIRNIQTTEEDAEQEQRIYDLPKTLAVNQTPSKNYWENSDYLSSMNKNYEIKQTTPDGSSGKFVTSMQENRFQLPSSTSSMSQISSSSIGTTQTAQSYEAEQKLRENRRRF